MTINRHKLAVFAHPKFRINNILRLCQNTFTPLAAEKYFYESFAITASANSFSLGHLEPLAGGAHYQHAAATGRHTLRHLVYQKRKNADVRSE
jgi:hypothetical protein